MSAKIDKFKSFYASSKISCRLLALEMCRKIAEDQIGFLKRQNRNFKTILVKNFLNDFTSTQMVGDVPASQYYMLYISGLGANPAELGFLRSLGLITAALISVPAGWLRDRYSMKKILLVGLVLHGIVTLNFIFANNWLWILPACIFAFVGWALHSETSSLILVNSLKDHDRATGMGVNRTFTAIPGLISPLIAAYIVTSFGGFNADGIRPLFYIQLTGLIIIFFFIATQLTDTRWKTTKERPSFKGDIREVFKGGVALKRWIFMTSVMAFTEGMIIPIRPLYITDVKGADPYILGAMTTASTIALLLFAIPMGGLSDRIGRKKVIFLSRPLYYASRLLLVFAPSPQYLIFVGALDALSTMATVTGVLWLTMQLELVTPSYRGTWQGIVLMLRAVFKAPAAIIGGILYMTIDPALLFLAQIVTDICLVLPVLITVPETLKHASSKEL